MLGARIPELRSFFCFPEPGGHLVAAAWSATRRQPVLSGLGQSEGRVAKELRSDPANLTHRRCALRSPQRGRRRQDQGSGGRSRACARGCCVSEARLDIGIQILKHRSRQVTTRPAHPFGNPPINARYKQILPSQSSH